MSSEPFVVRAEGVSKRYRIGAREPYKALRDVLAEVWIEIENVLGKDILGR